MQAKQLWHHGPSACAILNAVSLWCITAGPAWSFMVSSCSISFFLQSQPDTSETAFDMHRHLTQSHCRNLQSFCLQTPCNIVWQAACYQLTEG